MSGITAVQTALQSYLPSSALQLFVIVAIPLILGISYLSFRYSFPSNAPKIVRGNYPIIGAIGFFTERFTFYQRAFAQSPTGNYSFHLGKHPVVGVSGENGRKVFFDSKQLSFAEGYSVMFGHNTPNTSIGPTEDGFTKYFQHRLTSMLKTENFVRGLPLLIADTNKRLDGVASSPNGITDPFESVYMLVFQLTMRTLCCNDIANDPALLAKTLRYFHIIEESASPTAVIFPWLPTLGKLTRVYGGVGLYTLFQSIIDKRKKTGQRGEDPLQLMIDEGDDAALIIKLVIAVLFAGQLNSGINAAWVLCYLAENPKWMARAREEVTAIALKYNPDSQSSPEDQLSNIPVEAWETEFNFLDCCLKDSIRLHVPGCAFRRNVSVDNIQIGKEVIPSGAFMTYFFADLHQDPAIYHNPEQWDPSRYFPERAEDKKVPYGFGGWGLGRHPCLGMRFAKLEINLLIAHFLAKFDEYHLCNRAGEPVRRLPPLNVQAHSADKPTAPVYLKVHRREK